MTKDFVNRFGSVSRDYAAFRPDYPSDLFDWLTSVAPSTSVAWDCATGTGQAALELAGRFGRVIATDASSDQIAHATPHPLIDYRVAAAEASGIPDASIDLVTVAQALHWFDVERFFLECARVLVPGGVLAVLTYGPLHVDGATVDRVVQHYYHDIVGPYWPAERALVDSGYASVSFPWPQLAAPVFEMEAWWTLPDLLGYMGTWSSTTAYRQVAGEDPRSLIERRLARAWRDPEGLRRIAWPLRFVVCRIGSV